MRSRGCGGNNSARYSARGIAPRAGNIAITAAPIVFFDIAGPDMTALKDFYAANFGWTIDAIGTTGLVKTPNLDGALRQDPPEKIL